MVVKGLLEAGITALLGGVDVSTYNQRFIASHGKSLIHAVNAAQALQVLDASSAVTAASLISGADDGFSLKVIIVPISLFLTDCCLECRTCA